MRPPIDLRALERAAPLVAGIVLAIPTLLAHYLPMTDLALHEGLVGILRHLGDEAWFPPGLYILNLGHANQLFYVIAWLLSFAVGTAWAMKLVVASAQIGTMWAGSRLADHTGRSRWSVLLLAPLVIGFTYYWGLVANLVGVAAFLAALPILDRATEAPTPRRALGACALIVLLFFAHGSMMVAGAVFVAAVALAHPWQWRATLLRLTPSAFAGVFLVVYLEWSKRAFPRAAPSSAPEFSPVASKIVNLPQNLFGVTDTAALVLLAMVVVVVLAALIHGRFSNDDAEPVAARDLRTRIREHRFELAAAAFFVVYLAAPFQYTGATFVHQRFLGPAWAIAAICAGRRGDAPRLVKVVAPLVPLGILIVALPEFSDAHRTGSELDALIGRIPLRSSTCLVSLEPPGSIAEHAYSAPVVAARTVAVRGGRFSLSLTRDPGFGPLTPVRIDPRYRWDEFDLRTFTRGSRALVPADDMNRFGWAVGHSRSPELRDLLAKAFLPDARLVATSGDWMLFQSPHEQLPLTTPDGPAPPPDHETIEDRARALASAKSDASALPR